MTRDEFAARTHVSRETLERYDIWKALLEEWSQHTNLVARSTLGDFWGRHAHDSWQVLEHAPQGTRRWADIGSGAGFPGLAAAFGLMQNNVPDGKVYLVESIGKKCNFLREVIARTDAPAEVLTMRAESVPPDLTVDVVSARAVAALPKLLNLAKPLLKTGVTGLFLKGSRYEEELTEARKCWTFDVKVIPSRTGDGSILKIENAHHDR